MSVDFILNYNICGDILIWDRGKALKMHVTTYSLPVSGPSSSTDNRKNNYENSGIGAPRHDISIIVFYRHLFYLLCGYNLTFDRV